MYRPTGIQLRQWKTSRCPTGNWRLATDHCISRRNREEIPGSVGWRGFVMRDVMGAGPNARLQLQLRLPPRPRLRPQLPSKLRRRLNFQLPRPPPTRRHRPQYPRLELFAGGSYAQAGFFNTGHWAELPGWDASLGVNVTSWLGLVVEGGQFFGTSKIPRELVAVRRFPVAAAIRRSARTALLTRSTYRRKSTTFCLAYNSPAASMNAGRRLANCCTDIKARAAWRLVGVLPIR